MLIDEILWPEHPLGRDIAGSKESVAAITRDMILDYLTRQYQPGNTVLAVAGDIQHQDVVTMVSQVTANWTSRQPRTDYPPYQEKLARRVLIETRDTEQAHLCLALPGLSVTHPDRFKLDLLNVILGEGMSSRLFTEIRDNLGLVYSIHSYLEHLLDAGSITISAGVDIKNLPVAIRAILNELSRLKTRTPESELVKAKEFFKGHTLMRLEDSRSVAGWIGGQEILTGHILSFDEVISIIDAITTGEIQRLAGELLVGEQLRLAVVGPVQPDEPLEELLNI
jgi:predicted Zn-dependent peptidase